MAEKENEKEMTQGEARNIFFEHLVKLAGAKTYDECEVLAEELFSVVEKISLPLDNALKRFLTTAPVNETTEAIANIYVSLLALNSMRLLGVDLTAFSPNVPKENFDFAEALRIARGRLSET